MWVQELKVKSSTDCGNVPFPWHLPPLPFALLPSPPSFPFVTIAPISYHRFLCLASLQNCFFYLGMFFPSVPYCFFVVWPYDLLIQVSALMPYHWEATSTPLNQGSRAFQLLPKAPSLSVGSIFHSLLQWLSTMKGVYDYHKWEIRCCRHSVGRGQGCC